MPIRARISGRNVALATIALATIALTTLPAGSPAAETPLRVTTDHPGGNAIVEGIDGDVVRLRPDLRDTGTWWFYWSFRVRGAAGRTLVFRFSGPDPIGVRGPAVSRDGGRTWSWLGARVAERGSFRHAFGPEAHDVRFAFAVPYVSADLARFIARHSGNEALSVRPLTRSRKGREVQRLHVGRLDGSPPHRVLVTARHHACESMASWTLEGLVDAFLDAGEEGEWLRSNVELLAVPFVDRDGVEDGDQGKNRRPRDHNRDYSGESLYPEVRAIRDLVPRWSGGRLRVMLDLHCPWIRGAHNDVIYMVGSPDPRVWREQQRFARVLEAVRRGPIPYRARDNLPFGQAWNTAKNQASGMPASRWASGLDGVRLASTLEIPYATASGAAVTPASARAFGRDLARAIRRYLETGAGEPPHSQGGKEAQPRSSSGVGSGPHSE